MTLDAALTPWIGKTETLADVVTPDRVAGLAALLDKEDVNGGHLPPLGHWLLCPPRARQSELDDDGHPRRGGNMFLPPVNLPRRMWAGSQVEFRAAIPIGAEVQRRSTIAAITEKDGRSGKMVFVTVDHEILCRGATAVRERQNIVYRGSDAGGARDLAAQDAVPEPEFIRAHRPDPVQLFRYSALTFNAHRIHYDRDYARAVEGYPGLVVQGPYAATLLLDAFLRVHPSADVVRFAFRAKAPLFDTAPFALCGAGDRLWIRGPDGAVSMAAELNLA